MKKRQRIIENAPAILLSAPLRNSTPKKAVVVELLITAVLIIALSSPPISTMKKFHAFSLVTHVPFVPITVAIPTSAAYLHPSFHSFLHPTFHS